MTTPDTLLIQITDTHLLADPHALQAGWNTQASLDAVMQDVMATYQPDALLLTGDLVHDEAADAYRRLATQLRGAGIPVFALPGNHDKPALLFSEMNGNGIQVLGDARLGGWQILLLNDHLPDDDGGHLTEAELQRLQQCLTKNSAPALVALHHPPVDVGSRWLDKIRINNPENLFARLQNFPQVRATVCGHIHQEFDAQAQGIRILATPSTCRQFLPRSENFAVDDQQLPGYRMIRLSPDGNFSTHVHRVPQAQLAGYQLPT